MKSLPFIVGQGRKNLPEEIVVESFRHVLDSLAGHRSTPCVGGRHLVHSALQCPVLDGYLAQDVDLRCDQAFETPVPVRNRILDQVTRHDTRLLQNIGYIDCGDVPLGGFVGHSGFGTRAVGLQQRHQQLPSSSTSAAVGTQQYFIHGKYATVVGMV